MSTPPTGGPAPWPGAEGPASTGSGSTPGFGAPSYGTQPPYGAPYGGPPGYDYGPPEPQGRDGFAIAALIFAILGDVLLLGIIFGIIALVRTRDGRKKGRVMAIVAIVISVLWGVLFSAIAIAAINQAQDDLTRDPSTNSSSSAPTTPGTGDSASPSDSASEDTFLPQDIKAGDCLNGITGEGTVTSVTAVGCTTPHDAQAVAVFDLPGGAYPGDQQVDKLAEDGCISRVGKIEKVAAALDAGKIGVIYLSPRELQWSSLDDHSVACLVLNSDGQKLTSAVPIS